MESLFANFLTPIYFAVRVTYFGTDGPLATPTPSTPIHDRKSEEEYERRGKKEICKKSV
jgi:hypothetical protein